MYLFGKSPSRGARQKKYFPSNQFKTSKCLSKVVKASNQHANVPTTGRLPAMYIRAVTFRSCARYRTHLGSQSPIRPLSYHVDNQEY